jgi:hypothetical protein
LRGERKANFSVKLKTSQFDFSKTYALPLAIMSASKGIISGNFGKIVYKVGAKNKYDGIYTLKGRMGAATDRPTFSTTAWSWGYEVSLITTGPNSVALHNTGYSNDYTQPIVLSDGSVSRLGTFTPEFTFDDNGRSAVINSTVTDSKFDADKKIAYTAFFMNQPNFGPLAFYDTLTYKKAR